MAKNKFPAGMGGMNMNHMMKQVQKLQQDMMKMQDDLENETVEATVGGGMVKVTANAKKELLSIKIDKEAVDPDDVEMLEDLVLSAVKEALAKAEKLSTDKMSKITGGMNIPGIF